MTSSFLTASGFRNSIVSHDVDGVQKLIDRGADVNVCPVSDYTALGFAVHHQQYDIAELLLTAGADPDGPAVMFPLVVAAIVGCSDIAELLIAHGAEIDRGDSIEGGTPLMYAARFGRTKLVEVLIAAGADIDATDKAGDTALYWSLLGNQTVAAEHLLSAGADPNVVGKVSPCPLNVAAGRGLLYIVKQMIASGADIHSPDNTLAVTWAAQSGHHDVVEFLARSGFDLDAEDFRKNAALHYAVKNCHPQCVAVLLDHGANPRPEPDIRGETPLGLARRLAESGRSLPSGSTRSEYQEIVRLLSTPGRARPLWRSVLPRGRHQ